MKAKISIVNGKVIIELSKRSAKILSEIGDYSLTLMGEFEKAPFFSYSGEDVRKLMKDLHYKIDDALEVKKVK